MSDTFYFTVNGGEVLQGTPKDPRAYPHLIISFNGLQVFSSNTLTWLKVATKTYGQICYIIGVPSGSFDHYWNTASERIAYFLNQRNRFYVDNEEIIFFQKSTTLAKLDFEIHTLKRELSSLLQP